MPLSPVDIVTEPVIVPPLFASSEFEHRAIGTISEKPAYLMNSDGEGQAIALKGRVPIKVIGKTIKGLPLVASQIVGVATQGFWSDDYFAISLETSFEEHERLIEGLIL